ncbi:hypothetical protein MO767_18295 [Pseudomonas sp. UYIF39]|uniref:hypothetical protein n=1 Tax=Pseudomonas sp. UYIF39 TaxID=1630747 RepID=UPI00249EB5A1|nr:hypothetical protein [Pseudomonas sp. UYIF39]MDI3356286.1 hypothetical protein [Pseudomonas sp. UYIF39]
MKSSTTNSPPNNEQAREFAAGIKRLEQAIERERWSSGCIENATKVYELPEYNELLEQAYDRGFVGSDQSADGFDFEAINARPEKQLDGLPMAEIRRFVHALYRCERHNHGWSSLVLLAVQSGALGMIALRLTKGR